MLGWLKDKILTTIDHVISVFAGDFTQVDTAVKKYTPRDASDLYESILSEVEKSGFNQNCTVITSYENISILSSAGYILHDGYTTKLWLRSKSWSEPGASGTKIASSGIKIAGSPYHGNTYANVFSDEAYNEHQKA
jgi:hypothetical protein